MVGLDRRHHLRELTGQILAWGVALLITAVFVALLGDVFLEGAGRLSWSFFFDAPTDAGRGGGIAPILVSTLLILTVCLAVAVPVGLGTAIFLSEFAATTGSSGTDRIGHWVRQSLDALAAVPSIIFGLFGNVLFCHILGLGFSIVSGGLTLACMVLPTVIRTTEIGLRSVPRELRLGAAALALSRTTTLLRILLPAASGAVVAGLILGLGRAVAETAALIFTSGYVDRMPGSLLDSGRALSVHVYDLAMNIPGGNASAYASASVLILVLVAVNQLVTLLTGRLFPEGGRR